MSVVRLYGSRPTQCGYCAAKKESRQYVLEAISLAIDDYQALIDRGWRRSGMHLYQPDRDHICCVPYTIRLHAPQFTPSKAHVRVQRKLDAFLEHRPTGSKKRKRPDDDEAGPQPKKTSPSPTCAMLQAQLETVVWAYLEPYIDDTAAASAILQPKIQVRPQQVLRVHRRTTSAGAAHQGDSIQDDRSRDVHVAGGPRDQRLCTTARRSSTLRSHAHPMPTSVSAADVAAAIAARMTLPSSDMSVSAVNGFLNFCLADEPAPATAPPPSPLPAPASRQRSKRDWVLETVRPINTPEIYDVYKAYQAHVHADTAVTPSSFESFLVQSPLPAVPGSAEGSFFQLYRLDGELVAVGVIDVLGANWSSVYFFYKPNYAHLQLGTYSALREIARCTRGYYYMGYYIGSCVKMQYKARFTPSELLCPKTLTFVPLTPDVQARADADASKVVQLATSPLVASTPQDDDVIDAIVLVFPDCAVCVKDAKASLHPVVLEHLSDFAAMVGPHLASRLRVQMF
ncbi:hypothetical protein SPRG_07547 [Saprolegnia parasitica CBS 223.65]|uniref:Arginyl-tRNA--protein transferase 1 n=1 Tax=Saprolegnia parasitica (strain CBS 223.65) TaxID=695850 RepID=A0A067CKI0_SAPPC|nr:hypothetical protein SPRG_07547 [Saprolegnia parasitica CBS 223.65]KDO27297.1 hypothetical protein SPRG_07547 [Saprolegnia parasitica CBS 223.65]|eukprot:XP_012202071.1 hypothetical protein SPRG_07547 [Saprolegnia parasitica CBS 223.65]